MTSPQGWNEAHPAAPGAAQPAPQRRNGFGVAALILGLVGAVFFWTVIGGILLGLLALVFGILGYRRSKRGIATNGAMSVVGAVIGALALIASAIIVAVGASILNSDEFQSYSDCIQHAHSQSDRQQCEQDFKNDVSN